MFSPTTPEGAGDTPIPAARTDKNDNAQAACTGGVFRSAPFPYRIRFRNVRPRRGAAHLLRTPRYPFFTSTVP